MLTEGEAPGIVRDPEPDGDGPVASDDGPMTVEAQIPPGIVDGTASNPPASEGTVITQIPIDVVDPPVVAVPVPAPAGDDPTEPD
jgi:hypothetical protein